jgi:hypothetical protein
VSPVGSSYPRARGTKMAALSDPAAFEEGTIARIHVDSKFYGRRCVLPAEYSHGSGDATLCPRRVRVRTEEDERETAASSSEDDERTQLELCRAQLRAAQGRLAQVHEESEAQKRLNDASLRTAQKRLTVALGSRRQRPARAAAPLAALPSVCADALDALDRMSAHVEPGAGARIQGEFRRSCLLILHPDKGARDERNVALLRALQEEWKNRRTPSD